MSLFPLLFVSMMLHLASFLSSVCGFVTGTNAKNSRKNPEIQMNIIFHMVKRSLNDDIQGDRLHDSIVLPSVDGAAIFEFFLKVSSSSG